MTMAVVLVTTLILIGTCGTRHVPLVTRDKAGVDIVTEHFARTRPGTVPRLPASLFLDNTDHQEII